MNDLIDTRSEARRFWLLGAVLASLAVAAGAFGAHALRDLVPPARLATFETGVRYQMYHSLALLFVARALTGHPSAALRWAGRLFVTGIVVFSGSLYLLVLTGLSWLGAVTPLGGVAFLAGWGLLARAALHRDRPPAA